MSVAMRMWGKPSPVQEQTRSQRPRYSPREILSISEGSEPKAASPSAELFGEVSHWDCNGAKRDDDSASLPLRAPYEVRKDTKIRKLVHSLSYIRSAKRFRTFVGEAERERGVNRIQLTALEKCVIAGATVEVAPSVCPSMKKSEFIVSLLLVPVDALMLVAAGLFVYQLRFNNAWIVGLRPVLSTITPDAYLRGLGVVAILGVLVFAFAGLYTITSARKLREEALRVSYASSMLLMLVILTLFFSRQIFLSRFLLLGFLLFSILFVLLGRVIVRIIQRWLLAKGIGAHAVLLIGAGETAAALVREFCEHPEYGFSLAGHVVNIDEKLSRRLDEVFQKHSVDDVLVADESMSEAAWEAVMEFVDAHQRTLKYAADLRWRRHARREMSVVGTVPVVECKKTRLEGWGSLAKRLFDVIVASAFVLVSAPLMLLVAVLIKLDSRGPVFFRTLDDERPVERVGVGGRPFHHLKFRTMIPQTHGQRYTKLASKNTRTDGPLVKVNNDPRVTRLGRLLRRLSIDELPELFLVLAGSMSLVGPRPHFPEEVARYSAAERRVLTVQPGMTGLAQISGRSDLAFSEEVRLDTYYVENWSMLLDLWILLKTPWVVLRGAG